ncbi:MAG: competence/damage-inducible protein A [Longimicrobiales bacterium]
MTRSRPAVEIVTIGTELVLGTTPESNGAWLGRTLAAAGVVVTRRTAVPDDHAAIRAAVEDALRSTGIVLCTGGLGPTRDDFTKPVVADLYGVGLEVDERWLAVVRQRFEERGIAMPASNRSQAEVPRGALLFPNAHGTAPGLALDDAGRGLTILLPGVPAEMQALVEEHVLPFLLARFQDLPNPIVSRVIRTTGISESVLAERIDDLVDGVAPLTLAFLPAFTGEDLRLTSWGAFPAGTAEQLLDRAEQALRERLGAAVYGTGDADLATVVGERLRARRLTLAVAESCTGGLVAKRLTDAAGASDFFLAGWVSYSNAAKAALLGVAPALIERHGAVSEPVVRAMADGARAAAGADCAIAITGIAGPGGGSPDKPVGTVWIAVAMGTTVTARGLLLGGDRGEIRERSAQAVIALLLRLLEEDAR